MKTSGYNKLWRFIFDIVYNIDWAYYILKGFKVVVQSDSIKSKLYSIPSIQSLSQKAIIKNLKKILK